MFHAYPVVEQLESRKGLRRRLPSDSVIRVLKRQGTQVSRPTCHQFRRVFTPDVRDFDVFIVQDSKLWVKVLVSLVQRRVLFSNRIGMEYSRTSIDFNRKDLIEKTGRSDTTNSQYSI